MSRNLKVNCPRCGAYVKLKQIKSGRCHHCRKAEKQAMGDAAGMHSLNTDWDKNANDEWRPL